MDQHNPDTLVDIDFSPSFFRIAKEQADTFIDENERHATALVDPVFDGEDGEEFRSLTLDALYEEQSQTFKEVSATDQTPYEQLDSRIAAVESELTEAQERLENLSDADDERKRRLRMLAEHAIEYSPLSKKSANSLVRNKIKALERLDRAGLQQRIEELSAEQEQLVESATIADEAWPIPKILYGYSDQEPHPFVANAPEIDILIVDEFPVDVEPIQSADEVMAGLIERHGYTHRASIELAAILIQNSGRTFTPEELGDILYTDLSHFEGMDQDEEYLCKRVRIHSLLRQGRKGIARNVLAQEGFDVQCGWRYFKDAQDQTTNLFRKRRVYRSLPHDNENPADEFSEIVLVQDKATFNHMRAETFKVDTDVLAAAMVGDGGVVSETASFEEKEAATAELAEKMRRINDVIVMLHEKGILPDDMDTPIKPDALRKKACRYSSPRSKTQFAARMRALCDNINAYQSFPEFFPTQIAYMSVEKEFVNHKGSQAKKSELLELVSSLVEEYYTALPVEADEATEQSA